MVEYVMCNVRCAMHACAVRSSMVRWMLVRMRHYAIWCIEFMANMVLCNLIWIHECLARTVCLFYLWEHDCVAVYIECVLYCIFCKEFVVKSKFWVQSIRYTLEGPRISLTDPTVKLLFKNGRSVGSFSYLTLLKLHTYCSSFLVWSQ